MALRAALAVMLGLTAAACVGFAVYQAHVATGHNYCGMSYMWPGYFPVPVEPAPLPEGAKRRATAGYGLYLYRDGSTMDANTVDVTDVSGAPVLFVPGNAGSYRQVRSLASREHAVSRGEGADGRGAPAFDYFSIDFGEELSAFHGEVLWDQSYFVNDCIHTILALYRARNPETAPESVVVVGHSMGGMAARAAVTLPNHAPGSIRTIVTLATPHRAAPLASDMSVARFYEAVNGFWRKRVAPAPAPAEPDPEAGPEAPLAPAREPHLAELVLVSIAGGQRDALVRSDLCGVAGLVHPSRSLALSTTALEGAWASPDHLAIVWCEQVLHPARPPPPPRVPGGRLRQGRWRTAALLGLRGAQDADELSSARREPPTARARRSAAAEAECGRAGAAEQSEPMLRTVQPGRAAYAWTITDRLRRSADTFVLISDRPLGDGEGPSVFLCGGSGKEGRERGAGGEEVDAAEAARRRADEEEFEGGSPEGPEAPRSAPKAKKKGAPRGPAGPVDVSPLAFGAPGLRPAFQGPEAPDAASVPPFPTSVLLLPASLWHRHDRLLFFRALDSRAEAPAALPPHRAALPPRRPALMNITVLGGGSVHFPPSVWLTPKGEGEPLFHPLAYYAYPPAGIAEEVFVANATSFEMRLHEAPPAGEPPRADVPLFILSDPLHPYEVTLSLHLPGAAAQLLRWFGPALLPTAAAAVAMALVRLLNAWRTKGEAPHLEAAMLEDAPLQCAALFLLGTLLPGWFEDDAARAGAPFPHVRLLLPALHLLALGLALLLRRLIAAPLALSALLLPSAPPPPPSPPGAAGEAGPSLVRRASYAFFVALACAAHPAYALAASALLCLLPTLARLAARRCPPGSQEERDREAGYGALSALLLLQLLALAAVAPAGAAWTLRLAHGHWIFQADPTSMAAAVCALHACSLASGGGPGRPRLAAFGEGALRALQTRAFSVFALSHCFARLYCVPYIPAFVSILIVVGGMEAPEGVQLAGAPAPEAEAGHASSKGRELKKRR
eukprot:tig00001073_g6819.t1